MKHKMTCVLLLSNTSHPVNARYPNKLDSHWLLRKSLVKIDNGIFVDDCDELGRDAYGSHFELHKSLTNFGIFKIMCGTFDNSRYPMK